MIIKNLKILLFVTFGSFVIALGLHFNDSSDKNDIAAALNAITMIKDPTIGMDILNSTFAKNKRIDMLNFEKVKDEGPGVLWSGEA